MDEVIDRLSVRLYSSTVGAAAPGEDEDAVDDAEAEAKKASTEDCPAGWEAVSQRLVRLNVAIEFDIQFGLVERFVYRVDGNRCYTPNLGKFQFKDLHFKAQVSAVRAVAGVPRRSTREGGRGRGRGRGSGRRKEIPASLISWPCPWR